MRDKRSILLNKQISKMPDSNITIRQPFVLLEKLSIKTETKYFSKENNVMTNGSNTKRSEKINNNKNRSQSRSSVDKDLSLNLKHAEIFISQNQGKTRKTRKKNVQKMLLNQNHLSPIVLLEKLSLITIRQISGIKLKNSNLGINCLDNELENKTIITQKDGKSKEKRMMEVKHFSGTNISTQSGTASTKIDKSKLVKNVQTNVTDFIGNDRITEENDVSTQMSANEITSTDKCLTVKKLTNNNQMNNGCLKNDLAKVNEEINNIICLGIDSSNKKANKQKLECKIIREKSVTNENILINESSSFDHITINDTGEQCAKITEKNDSATNEIGKNESISDNNTASIESIEFISTKKKPCDDNDEIHVIDHCIKQNVIDNDLLIIEKDSGKESSKEKQIETSTNDSTSQELCHDEQTTEIINCLSEQNSIVRNNITIENHLVNELSINDVMDIEKDDFVEKSSAPDHKKINIIVQANNENSIGNKISQTEKNESEKNKTGKTEEKNLSRKLSSVGHIDIDCIERTNLIDKQPMMNKEVDKQISIGKNIMSHELDHCYNKCGTKLRKNHPLEVQSLDDSEQLSVGEIITKKNEGNQNGSDDIHNTIFVNNAISKNRNDSQKFNLPISIHMQLSNSSTDHQELRNDEDHEELSNEIEIEECKYNFQASEDSIQKNINTPDSANQSRNSDVPKCNGIQISLKDACEKITADLNTFQESFQLESNSADHHIPEISYISDSSDDGVKITEETNLVANHKSTKVKKGPFSDKASERKSILDVIKELCAGPIKLNKDAGSGNSRLAGQEEAESTQITLYECPSCKKIFSGRHYFQKHYSTCCRENNVFCQICSTRVGTLYKLKKHLEQSHSEFVRNVSANSVAREMMRTSIQEKNPTPESAKTISKFYSKTSPSQEFIKLPPWISLFCPVCGDVFDSLPNTYSKQCSVCNVGLTARCLECKIYLYASAEMESHINGCDRKKPRRRTATQTLNECPMWKKPRQRTATQTLNECPMCPYVTQRKHDMYRHMVKRHSRIVVMNSEKCTVGCGRTFSSRLGRLRHDKYCGKEANLTCNFCPFKSRHRSVIKTHIQTHVLNNDKKLPVTSKNEGDVARLEKEARDEPELHEKIRRLMGAECRKCTKISIPRTSSNFCENCLGPLIFHCTKCNTLTPDFWKMKLHLIRNHFDKVLKCNMCNASYSYTFDLEKHLQSHCTKVTKKWRCYDFCPFRATTSRGLEQHKVRMHPETTAAMCSCNKCGKLFTTQGPMLRHAQSCGVEPNLNCDHCTFKTKSKFSLRRHMQNLHHKIISSICYNCDYCFKEFTNLYAYETHVCLAYRK